MKVDAIVAGGCAASYVATAAWAGLGSGIAAPFATVVTVKDAIIAGVCFAWLVAERRAGLDRARRIALVVALIIVGDAVLALVGGAGPWRTEIAPNGSLVGSLIVGVGLIVASLALLWFVRRPDPTLA